MALSSPRNVVVSPTEIFAVGLIVACWMLPGLFGREPWKPDEAYTFGLVWQMLQGGDWLVPRLAGEPFMEKPPIFFWTAAAFAKAFGEYIGTVSAARLANVFYVIVTLTAIAAAGRAGQRRWTVLALVGTLGLVTVVHLLFTDIALMAGMSLGVLGLILSQRRTTWGGLLLGTGAGLAFLAKGLIGPGILAIVALSLPLVGTTWRGRTYAHVLGIALLAALPWLLIWPTALYLQQPDLFKEWIWDNNFGRFLGLNTLGPTATRQDYANILGLFCFPTLPLALWNLRQEWRQTGRWATDSVVALMICVVGLGVLLASAQVRDVYLLPIFPALALLAGRNVGGSWTRRLILTVIALALVAVLVGWLALVLDWPSAALDRFVSARWVAPPVNRLSDATLLAAATVVALFTGLIWISRRTPNLLLPWSGGIAVIWFAFISLYLPWLSPGNEYRGLMQEVAAQLSTLRPNCLASEGLGEPQRGMLDYYAKLRTERLEKNLGQSCRALLVQSLSTSMIPKAGWHEVWHGSRPGDLKERFSLWIN